MMGPVIARLGVAALILAASGIASAQAQRDPDNAPRYDDRRGDDRRYGDGRDDRGRDDRDRDDRRGGPRAVLFSDDKFRGRSVVIDGPVRRLTELRMDDRISSIDVRGGTWLVCVDDGFRGRCETIDRSIRRLDRMGLDDKVSSIRPVRPRY